MPGSAPRSSPALNIVSLVYFSHPDRCAVASHHDPYAYFHNEHRHGASFHELICHSYIFFAETSVQIFCTFFEWVLRLLIVQFGESFTNSRCCLFQICVLHMFLPVLSLPFSFCYLCLSQHNLKMKSDLPWPSFIDSALEAVGEKSLPSLRSESFSPGPSSRSFLVLSCAYGSVIPFEVWGGF